ncbi:MAG TPA: hypothetical protein VEZ89_01745 [Rubrivivax sp.]|nr:hypothetical protein [Rubrivivax sp.]
MESIFFWLAGSVAGLLMTAAAVAVWEHLRRSVRPHDEFTSSAPKAVKIDLRLDRLPAQASAAAPLAETVAPPISPAAAAAATEMEQRRAALDEVLARMAQPGGVDRATWVSDGNDDSLHDGPRFWAETTPMVGPGQLDAHETPLIKRPGEFSASQQP